MSLSAVTLSSQADTLNENSANPTQDTDERASNADANSTMTKETVSSTNTDTFDHMLITADDGVAQDLFELLKNQRPDHLKDPSGAKWSSLVASLNAQCEIYLKKGWPTSTLVVIGSYDWNIPVAFGRTGVEGRFFTCSMFFWTNSRGQLFPVGDAKDGYVDQDYRKNMVNRHNSLNRKIQETSTNLSDSLTLERLLNQIDVNRHGSHQVSVNGNDSAAWLRLAPDESTSTLIGVIDLKKEVCYEEVWYDAPEPES